MNNQKKEEIMIEDYNIYNSIKIILDQCDKAIKIDKEILIKLLKINNNDISECIIDIEYDRLEEKLKKSDEEINWELLLMNTNYDIKVIRKLLDERDRLINKELLQEK